MKIVSRQIRGFQSQTNIDICPFLQEQFEALKEILQRKRIFFPSKKIYFFQTPRKLCLLLSVLIIDISQISERRWNVNQNFFTWGKPPPSPLSSLISSTRFLKKNHFFLFLLPSYEIWPKSRYFKRTYLKKFWNNDRKTVWIVSS